MSKRRKTKTQGRKPTLTLLQRELQKFVLRKMQEAQVYLRANANPHAMLVNDALSASISALRVWREAQRDTDRWRES